MDLESGIQDMESGIPESKTLLDYLTWGEAFITAYITNFIIKFPYNAHSDWLKQRALSENKARVDDDKLAFEFVIRNFDKFEPN